MQRIQRILGHLNAPTETKTASVSAAATAAKLEKRDDDIVIVSAVRTAIGRAKKGGFKDTPVEDMLAAVLKSSLERAKIKDSSIIGDIVVGCVLGPNGQRATEARIAAFLAGIPDTVPVHTLNRQCSSGLQAVAEVAAAIRAGYYDIGIGAGMESMSKANMMSWEGMNPRIFMNKQAQSCLMPMGITSENVAKRFGVTRQEQDDLAVKSHAKAAAAIKAGRFKEEICPVQTKIKDPKTGEEKKITVDTDEGVREETTIASLSKLSPAFAKDGTTTAGNASQVSDGAAACVVTTRKKAKELGLPILGIFKSFAVTGVDPAIMGIGPATAIPAAVKKAGLTLDDIDLYEINEAFASQAVYCVKHLGISWDKVNPNGGGISLGHPLGCTGARMIATALHDMKRRNLRYSVISMCIGTGMGAAAVLARDDE